MTGVENIVKSIEDDANKLAGKILDDAKLKAESVFKAANQKATGMSLDMTDKAEKIAKLTVERAKSSALIEKKRAILAEKSKIVSDTIDSAKKYLMNLPDCEYFDFLLKIFKNRVSKDSCILIFSKDDLNRMPDNFKLEISKLEKESNIKIEISKIARDFSGGFIISYGEIEENCTIDALFSDNVDSICDELNKILFS